MTVPPYDFARYLDAKSAVDDRALNATVREALVKELSSLPTETVLRTIEAGAGLGAMSRRLIRWLPHPLRCLLVDGDDTLVEKAAERMPEQFRKEGWSVRRLAPRELELKTERRSVTLKLEARDALLPPSEPGEPCDLLVAHAFLDLPPLEEALKALFGLLRPGGLFYFTLVFDGCTVLQPPLDTSLDDLMEECYHRAMDKGEEAHSRTGRRLLDKLAGDGIPVLAAGSSDWLVYPPYAAEEPYFLHHILHFMEDALEGCPHLEPSRVRRWLAARHLQVEEERLVFMARHIDVLGRWRP